MTNRPSVELQIKLLVNLNNHKRKIEKAWKQ